MSAAFPTFVRRGGLRMMVAALLSLLVAEERSVFAAAPAPLIDFAEAFDSVIAADDQVWVCRYAEDEGDQGVLRQVVAGGGPVAVAPVLLPEWTFQVEAAPDGSFYAVARGGETNVNPSVHLWHRRDEAWVPVGQVRGVDYSVRVRGATISFPEGRVVVAMSVQWTFFRFGSGAVFVNGPPTPPPLAIYDPVTGGMSFGPAGIEQVVGDGPLFGVRVASWRDLAMSRDGGDTWSYHLSRQLPRRAVGQRQFYGGDFSFGPGVVVGCDGGKSMDYPLPFADHGYGLPTAETPAEERYYRPELVDFVVARGGEGYLGVFRQRSYVGNTYRHVAVWSDDYLQSFGFLTLADEAHLGMAATGEAIYLLRATASGCRLYRAALAAAPIPVTTRPSLRLTARAMVKTSDGLSEPDGTESPSQLVTMLQLAVPAADEPGGFLQLETSTDLIHWTPLGLPVPGGQALELSLGTDTRRFFR